MRTVQVREAKAGLSELIEAATHGQPTTITRHGVPAAAIVSIEDVKKLYPSPKKSFVEHLLDFPGELEIERPEVPFRDIDL